MSQYFYLHGFASGPNSKKARFFKRQLAHLDIKLEVLDLNWQDFANFKISESLRRVFSLINDKETILIGSSLGGLMSLILAEHNLSVKKVVLLAPALEINSLWPVIVGTDNLDLWQTKGKLPIFHTGYNQTIDLHYDFLLDLQDHQDRDFKRDLPVLVFHGINDSTIPPKVSEHYAISNPSACLNLINSDHGLEDSLEEIWQNTRRFLVI